jgi:hypothetical protein
MKKILMNLAFTATAIILISTGQAKVKAAEQNSITYEKNIDIVKDYVIDSKDLATLAKDYNKTSKSAGWNNNNDINSDGIIDIYDLVTVSKSIGKNITIEEFTNYDFAEVGQKYTLQSTIRAKLGDKDYIKLPIKWNGSANTSAEGKYTYTGVIEGYNKSLSFNLTVVPVNIDANINSYAFMTFDGTYIYYNPFTEEGLYKANIDGSNAKKLNDDCAYSINVYNGWIYYLNMNDEGIYKVKTDGTDRTILSSGYYEFLWIYKGTIYCTDFFNMELYSMKLDGTDKKKLIGGEPGLIRSVNFIGDHIYCSRYNKSMRLEVVKSKLDGSSQENLSIFDVLYINVSGNYLYYIDCYDNRIYRTNLDGTNIVKLNDNNSLALKLIGDWIYYLTEEENSDLCKVRRLKNDGTVDEQIIDIGIQGMNIRAGRIYFYGEDGIMYSAKMDGTDIRKFN